MIKLFHYDIYEYELLQEELNKLAKQGYTTDKISYLTTFHQTNEKVYYLVDVFTTNETKDKYNEELRKYVKYYLDNKYELISNFNNILVFKGHKELKPRPLKQDIAQKEKSIRLFQFLLSLIFLFIIYLFFISPLKPYHLLTNGNILFYISILFIPISIMYRSFLRWSGIYQLSKALSKNQKFELKNIKQYYFASTLLPIAIISLIVCSYILDIFNTRVIDIRPDNIPTLESFEINKDSEYSLYKKTSLIVPESYEYVETTTDNQESMLIQIYTLQNETTALALLEDFINNPELLYMEKFKQTNENEYLGYYNNKAYIKIKIDKKTITLINTSFEIK